MDILEQAKQKIVYLHTCDSAYIIAHAAWSACDHRMYPGPCAMDISSGLDSENREIVFGLQNITNQPDFSNSDQEAMLHWLHARGYSKWLAKKFKTHAKKLIWWER